MSRLSKSIFATQLPDEEKLLDSKGHDDDVTDVDINADGNQVRVRCFCS